MLRILASGGMSGTPISLRMNQTYLATSKLCNYITHILIIKKSVICNVIIHDDQNQLKYILKYVSEFIYLII